MTKTSEAVPARVTADGRPPIAARTRLRTTGERWRLAAVAGAFTLAQLVLVPPGTGSRLGRDGVRQPGQRPRSRGILQRAARPRHLSAWSRRSRPGRLHRAAARSTSRCSPASASSSHCACGGACSGRRARPGRRAVRLPVDHAVLRPAGHAQLLGGRRRLVCVGCFLRAHATAPTGRARWGWPRARRYGVDAADRRRLGDLPLLACWSRPPRAAPRLLLVLVAGLRRGRRRVGGRGVRRATAAWGGAWPTPPASRAAWAGTSPSATSCAAWADAACAARAPVRCPTPR